MAEGSLLPHVFSVFMFYEGQKREVTEPLLLWRGS